MIIGILGRIGSGKSAAADILLNEHKFVQVSFADSLKSAVSAVFGWKKELLDGFTSDARTWREQVDPWWAARLNMPGLTPRKILQVWGTDLCRNQFHGDIWVASLERKLLEFPNVVISDVRFPNEVDAIRRNGGVLVTVERGLEPDWVECAERDVFNNRVNHPDSEMAAKYPEVHYSEWAWVLSEPDYLIDNNGTLAELNEKLLEMLIRNQGLDLRKTISASS